MMTRDEFGISVKRILAARVCHRCSNPRCRHPTSGPQEHTAKITNIGVASHIRAASPNGPRYDPTQSAEERGAIDNAIWLCQNCAKLVDDDVKKFPSDLLESWKAMAETQAFAALQRRSQSPDTLDLFVRLSSKMPPILQEMAEDLHSDDSQLIREFIVLPSEGASFWHEYPRFEYYETQHPNIQNAIRLLMDHGFVTDVTPKRWTVYRMTEEFVDLVKELFPPL